MLYDDESEHSSRGVHRPFFLKSIKYEFQVCVHTHWQSNLHKSVCTHKNIDLDFVWTCVYQRITYVNKSYTYIFTCIHACMSTCMHTCIHAHVKICILFTYMLPLYHIASNHFHEIVYVRVNCTPSIINTASCHSLALLVVISSPYKHQSSTPKKYTKSCIKHYHTQYSKIVLYRLNFICIVCTFISVTVPIQHVLIECKR